jgi:Transcriptional repressor TCF25
MADLSDSTDTDHNCADETELLAAATRPNFFYLLEDEDSYAQEEEREENEDEQPAVIPAVQSLHKVSLKKKKKSKSKKEKIKPITEYKNEEKDSLDILVETLDTMKLPGSDFSADKNLLKIEKKFLNYESEQRKLFGSSIVKKFANQNNRDPRVQALDRKTKGYFLCQPVSLLWLRLSSTDLSMTIYYTSQDYTKSSFKFTHGPPYIQSQYDFFDATRSHDPSFYNSILQVMPLHVDSLLSFSDFFVYQGKFAEATEFVGRAIFSLEKSFHASFRPLDHGLDYNYYENRSLFLALFKYIDLIGRKGCWKCAFEYCKLLLNLSQGPYDDKDPMGCLFMIDFYAMKAADYNFLLSETYRSLCKLPDDNFLLPNFYYSHALATWHTSGPSEASLLLYEAFLAYPLIMKLLVEDKKVVMLTEEEEQAYLAYFSPIDTSSNSTINLIQKIYVQRAFHLWKEPRILNWLRDSMISFLLQATNPSSPSELSSLSHLNVYRHLLLSSICHFHHPSAISNIFFRFFRCEINCTA